MKNLQCKLTRKRWMEIGVSVLLFVLIIAWALVLEYTEPDREATAARKRYFAVARVTDILDDNAETQDWTEGRRIGQQYLEVEILNGPWKGEILETINYLTIYTNVDAKIGTKIVVRLDLDDAGEPYVISIPNYNRAPVLIGLLAVFAALLLLIGRKKGLTALLGLVYTLACVWFIQVPMILRGAQPVVVTVVLVALTTAASLLFLNGFSRKTLCATLGCIGGVAVAGIFAARQAGEPSTAGGAEVDRLLERYFTYFKADDTDAMLDLFLPEVITYMQDDDTAAGREAALIQLDDWYYDYGKAIDDYYVYADDSLDASDVRELQRELGVRIDDNVIVACDVTYQNGQDNDFYFEFVQVDGQWYLLFVVE